MLCYMCTGMLRDHSGLRKNVFVDLHFDHHQSTKSLLLSLEQGCSICSVLARRLEMSGTDLDDGRGLHLEAILSVMMGRQLKRRYYSLDFLLKRRVIGTFFLQPKDQKGPKKYTLSSIDVYSKQVFNLAERWISECTCADGKQEWYPDRLLDLREIKSALRSKETNLSRARVYLLQNSEAWKKKESMKSEDNRYVSLSHCWGQKPVPVRLVAQNMEELMTRGIALQDLPKTFHDAAVVAGHLKGVRYIWIDSLCIVQKSEEDDHGLHAEDWYTQSAVMDKVYHKAYLNISAATSPDSSGGLFQKRNLDALHEENVDLNIAGLLDLENPRKKEKEHAFKSYGIDFIGGIFKCLKRGRRRSNLRKCAIIDVSLWNDLVDEAPVNTRGWVYQERLLAPRILHFCNGQIAWECSERDCSERYPEGIPCLQLKTGQVVHENRLKNIDPEREGKSLREARLEVAEDPDKDLPRLYTYELWRRIVEVYSQKRLTVGGDKLIALSGIARHFFSMRLDMDLQLPKLHHPYVAGLWNEYLESQLLWYVEPTFEDGVFGNLSKRNNERAPSFSWAALDAPQGIRYGGFTNRDVLFRVEDIHMEYVDEGNKFGMLHGSACRLLLQAQLIEVDLRRLDQSVAGAPYGWKFVECEGCTDLCDDGMHGNVYLDSPDSDADIFEPYAKIFCVPAARGERTAKPSERYLFCLLLQLKGERGGYRMFKRIGLTKLSSYEEEKAQKVLDDAETEYFDLY